MTRLQIALVGDSLTQQSFDLGGWGARLASLYQRKADVKLRGYSGYNTRWALETLDHNFPSSGPKYDLATLWYGANDAALPDQSCGRQSVPIEEYKENLGVILDRLKSLAGTVVVFTPPPVAEKGRIKLAIDQYGADPKTATPERTLQAAHEYALAAQEVARSRGVPSLDLWTNLQEIPNWESLLLDGLHFNPDGNKAVFDIFVDFLNDELPQFKADSIPPDFPWHTDIDTANYRDAFQSHSQARKTD